MQDGKTTKTPRKLTDPTAVNFRYGVDYAKSQLMIDFLEQEQYQGSDDVTHCLPGASLENYLKDATQPSWMESPRKNAGTQKPDRRNEHDCRQACLDMNVANMGDAGGVEPCQMWFFEKAGPSASSGKPSLARCRIASGETLLEQKKCSARATAGTFWTVDAAKSGKGEMCGIVRSAHAKCTSLSDRRGNTNDSPTRTSPHLTASAALEDKLEKLRPPGIGEQFRQMMHEQNMNKEQKIGAAFAKVSASTAKITDAEKSGRKEEEGIGRLYGGSSFLKFLLFPWGRSYLHPERVLLSEEPRLELSATHTVRITSTESSLDSPVASQQDARALAASANRKLLQLSTDMKELSAMVHDAGETAMPAALQSQMNSEGKVVAEEMEKLRHDVEQKNFETNAAAAGQKAAAKYADAAQTYSDFANQYLQAGSANLQANMDAQAEARKFEFLTDS